MIDRFLINRLDRLTTKLQKKGIALTSIHVYAMAALLFVSIGDCIVNFYSGTCILVAGIVWGPWLIIYQLWERKNRDYYLSKKKTDNLNAEVVTYRSIQLVLRIIFWVLLIPMAALDILAVYYQRHSIAGGIVGLIHDALPLVCWYLNCCTFIGPGEFAKEKKASLAALPQAT